MLVPPDMALNEMEVRSCAVCGGTETRSLFTQKFCEAASHTLMKGYEVVTCNSCGFCFADRIPPQSEFDRYYAELSKYENASHAGKESPYDATRFDVLAQVVGGSIADRSLRILEVGCASGGLLARLKRDGFVHVTGLDPSPMSARIAQQQFGLDVVVGSIFSNPLPPSAYDVVVLIGVLEHIRDLRGAIAELQRLLTPTGRVLLTVPDASRYYEGDDAPFQEFSVEHINFFGPSSLSNLFARAEFNQGSFTRQLLSVAHRTTTPVVHAVFGRDLQGCGAAWSKDSETLAGLERYIEKSNVQEQGIQERIRAMVAEGRPIVVWGTGTHTLRLLATSDLGKALIRAFVDSNPHYQGKSLGGVPVISPTQLSAFQEPILVSSRAFQAEIVEQIRANYQYRYEVVTLYD